MALRFAIWSSGWMTRRGDVWRCVVVSRREPGAVSVSVSVSVSVRSIPDLFASVSVRHPVLRLNTTMASTLAAENV